MQGGVCHGRVVFCSRKVAHKNEPITIIGVCHEHDETHTLFTMNIIKWKIYFTKSLELYLH